MQHQDVPSGSSSSDKIVSEDKFRIVRNDPSPSSGGLISPASFYGDSGKTNRNGKNRATSALEEPAIATEPAQRRTIHGSSNTKFYVSPNSSAPLPSYYESLSDPSVTPDMLRTGYRPPEAIVEEHTSQQYNPDIVLTTDSAKDPTTRRLIRTISGEFDRLRAGKSGWDHDCHGPSKNPNQNWGETPETDWAGEVVRREAAFDPNRFESISDFGDELMSGYKNENLMLDHGLGIGSDAFPRFWDEEWLKQTGPYPGPGMLPSRVEELIHDPDHTLFSLKFDDPPPLPQPETQSSSSSQVPQPSQYIPTKEELTSGIPHPHALYCKGHNGWVILYAGPIAQIPPLTSEFAPDGKPYPPPLDPSKRGDISCLSDRSSEHTHHYHFYERGVDGASLEPRIDRSTVEFETVQIHGASGPPLRSPSDVIQAPASQNGPLLDRMDTDSQIPPEIPPTIEAQKNPLLFDLFACCHCQAGVLCSSSIIDGVIPQNVMDRLVKEKEDNPVAGRSKEAGAVLLLDTMTSIIGKCLWRENHRAINTTGKGFTSKIGWSDAVAEAFRHLGFHVPSDEDRTIQGKGLLAPPSIDPSTEAGQRNRGRLLRAWVELSAWLAMYMKQRSPEIAKDSTQRAGEFPLVRASSAREDYQKNIGSHSSQMPRLDLHAVRADLLDEKQWQVLGLTVRTHKADLVEYAYRQQVHCDPPRTPSYLFLLERISHVELLPNYMQLQAVVVIEKSKGLWTTDDVNLAAQMLGFGEDGHLRISWDSDVEDDFLMKAWWNMWKRVDNEFDYDIEFQLVNRGHQGSKKEQRDAYRRDLKEALRILCQSKGSKEASKMYEQVMRMSIMSLADAYQQLGASADFDDSVMITIYNMRVMDQPAQQDKMMEALRMITEDRNSARLRTFVETGRDDGDLGAVIKPEWPRGLNQLGNTCYLNSLLQYFYTIKDLREAIAAGKFAEDTDQLSEDDIKRHPIGGRLVTKKEIERSKKFVRLLNGLFTNLEYAETPAVTPEIDLAKLALITSKDEETETLVSAAAQSKDSSLKSVLPDGTLTEPFIGPVRPPPPPPSPTQSPITSSHQPPPDQQIPNPSSPPSSTVLGKRPFNAVERRSTIEIDGSSFVMATSSEQTSAGLLVANKPQRANTEPLQSAAGPLASQEPSQSRSQGDGDVEMTDASQVTSNAVASTSKHEDRVYGPPPPPLPPRNKKPEVRVDMMFGKQNDVAECMDNCMFQIEAAMQFDVVPAEDRPSLIKRLLYGKKRQRIQTLPEPNKPPEPVREKEEIFAQLLVNVSEEGYDLYDGLAGFLDDTIDFEGKKAKMEVELLDLPPLLQIQLQRVQFDRQSMQQYKSNAYVKFGATLDMGRFLANADPGKKARSKAIQAELKACRDQVSALTTGPGAPYADALAFASKYLSERRADNLLGVGTELPEFLNRERVALSKTITDSREQATKLKEQLEELWRDDGSAEYELCSVFIHRGTSPSWGHYFFYSRNLPDDPDSWFKYNDSDVSVVSKEEVLADTTGSTANPYLLVYARKGSGVIDTLHRHVITDKMELA